MKKVTNYKMNSAERADKGCRAAKMWYDRKTTCSECPFPVDDCLDGKHLKYIEGYFKCKESNEIKELAMALAINKDGS